ncbi:MAG: PilZ domain-containing protein [Pseudobdellovibrionaceae bacterium]
MQQNEVQESQWYVLKSSRKYGPFGYIEMIKMMQQKALFDFDYVWTQGLPSWTPLARLDDFSHDRLTELVQSGDKSLKDSFIERRCPRVPVSVPLIIHNDQLLWKGRSLSISENGALILMENPALIPGQMLNIHFKRLHINDEPFNVTAELISKKISKELLHSRSCLKYAVRFLTVTPDGQKTLKHWVESDPSVQLRKAKKA